MKTTIALIIKLFVTFVAAWVAFMVFGTAGLLYAFLIALAGTVLNYLIGDLFILPKFGNLIAAICDGILAAVLSYIILAATFTYYTATSLAIFAVMVVVFEVFFHMYLFKADIIRKKTDNVMQNKKLNFSTETAKEMHPSFSKNSEGSDSYTYNHSSNICSSSTSKDDSVSGSNKDNSNM